MNRRPTPLDNEQCRQCSSFSDYIKSTKKKKDENDNIKSGVDSKTANQVGFFIKVTYYLKYKQIFHKTIMQNVSF